MPKLSAQAFFAFLGNPEHASVRMLHKKFKKAGMFLNMTEILIVPEVAHDACGVIEYLVNAFSGLSG